MTTKICYLHHCDITPVSITITNDIVDRIISSGLINELESLVVVNIGNDVSDYLNDRYSEIENIKCIYASSNIKEYEMATAKRLQSYCKTIQQQGGEDVYCLYLHNKGATKTTRTTEGQFHYANVFDWKNRMIYFLVDDYINTLRFLDDGYSSVGCDLRKFRFIDSDSHYSGNFWWAKSSVIAKLPDISKKTNPFSVEGWGISDIGTPKSVHNCYTNQYNTPLPPHRYQDIK